MSDGTDFLLTEAALGALEAFAALLVKSDLGLPQRRSILRIAWDTAREGDALLQHEDPMASLTASEIALAELGAVCLSAAVEAQLALSGAALRAARSQVPQQVPPWEWIRWRVDACARAALTAGVDQEKCESLRNIAATLLEPYRLQFQRIERQELAALQKQQAQQEALQQQKREQDEKRQLQQQRIEELKRQKDWADPDLREAMELEMKELEAQVASIPMQDSVAGTAGATQPFGKDGDVTGGATLSGAAAADGEDVEEPDPKLKRDGDQKAARGGNDGGPVKEDEDDMTRDHRDHGKDQKDGQNLSQNSQDQKDEMRRDEKTPTLQRLGKENDANEDGREREEHVSEARNDRGSGDESRVQKGRSDEKDKHQRDHRDPDEADETPKDQKDAEDQKLQDGSAMKGKLQKDQKDETSEKDLWDQRSKDGKDLKDGKDRESETSSSKVSEKHETTSVKEERSTKDSQVKDSKSEVKGEKTASSATKDVAKETSASPEVPRVLWVEPSGKTGPQAVWLGPLSAGEVLKMAEESKSLGPDGLIWGLASGSMKGQQPPEDGKGAQPLWQCLPELGQQLRRASEVQLQQRLENRFKTMPRQEDATDVLPS
ncbi:unnamed protein product [Cladocopium goreaui]|uniref:Copper-transporting ATPase n=1 Tax=Cladocopium goreaui TaxID=2562237 RepID=A0A9P1GHY4_9DINO|nr:unnamed protein product [Cladocopium goreaui]